MRRHRGSFPRRSQCRAVQPPRGGAARNPWCWGRTCGPTSRRSRHPCRNGASIEAYGAAAMAFKARGGVSPADRVACLLVVLALLARQPAAAAAAGALTVREEGKFGPRLMWALLGLGRAWWARPPAHLSYLGLASDARLRARSSCSCAQATPRSIRSPTLPTPTCRSGNAHATAAPG